jgi:phage terminase small subunit
LKSEFSMPALKNPRHERFAQEMMRAAEPAAAYRFAGYKSEGALAEARASRLLQNATVAARIVELQTTPENALTVAEVTTATAIIEFEEARKLALKKGQASAAVSATLAKAKLACLFAKKPESTTKRTVGFDGNYNEAARRIAFLLHLAAEETSDEHKR